MKILVIDDDAYVARALLRMFGRSDHDIDIELDGVEGVTRVVSREREGSPYDVVLCDYVLDQVTGLDVISMVNARCRLPPICILISGTEHITCASTLADAQLVKPLRVRDVERAVSEIKLAREAAADQG